MRPGVRNSLAVLAGLALGMVINGGFISVGGVFVPPPEGVDTTTTQGLRDGIHLFGPMHFVVPFLAHAIGTFIGAFVAALIAVSHHMKIALLIGLIFLLGGITASFMIPAPAWFIGLDLMLAYIPPALFGGWMVARNRM